MPKGGKENGPGDKKSKELQAWLEKNRPELPEDPAPQLPKRAYDMMAEAKQRRGSNLSERDSKTYFLIDALSQKIDIHFDRNREYQIKSFRAFLRGRFPGESVATLQVQDNVFDILLENNLFMIDEVRSFLQNPEAVLAVPQSLVSKVSPAEALTTVKLALQRFEDLTSE